MHCSNHRHEPYPLLHRILNEGDDCRGQVRKSYFRYFYFSLYHFDLAGPLQKMKRSSKRIHSQIYSLSRVLLSLEIGR